ncbi:ATP-dependent zinc protease [Magnetofaba australis]|uniref:Putative 30S ribosomal protein S6 modification protein-like protein n=1 Tax=Magnetofaba australis IT-1 TaxID=1434232 RepID=A0A1Y2K743_9PROT|nr:ATP-dependent zinc protease [Magnetofaba australis]OSM04261.1 putative 30S ribosomal protein S6 modification protein-like protein [Magnetofaba australis IT-1]
MASGKKKKYSKRLIIGWREWVTLPEFGGLQMKAKIDSGARTSSLHAFHIREMLIDGAPWVSFDIHPFQNNRHHAHACLAQVIDRRKVRSSNGKQEMRYVIESTLSLGGDSWPVEITLANRDEMGFRLLLGRTALRKRFLIHCGRSYLVSVPPASH